MDLKLDEYLKLNESISNKNDEIKTMKTQQKDIEKYILNQMKLLNLTEYKYKNLVFKNEQNLKMKSEKKPKEPKQNIFTAVDIAKQMNKALKKSKKNNINVLE